MTETRSIVVISTTNGGKLCQFTIFSVCLAPIYDTMPQWLLLAEFIEHHKLQGVTYFYIYIKEMEGYTRTLIDDYVRTGDAEVIILHDRFMRDDPRWKLPHLQVSGNGR
ncbi:hypothetical protein KIN20_016700 [Parelaphostrongylus tenuis]|uniref:Glycosyltransferase family 92 protein n=1 Tax=Parelaphostrongylus tenuis TaxID=148309 RepID=A0AAD5MKD0_PARTN|nr:hypothetical protein KIN20_016700 [Parelaphostrongylus tenuis]